MNWLGLFVGLVVHDGPDRGTHDFVSTCNGTTRLPTSGVSSDLTNLLVSKFTFSTIARLESRRSDDGTDFGLTVLESMPVESILDSHTSNVEHSAKFSTRFTCFIEAMNFRNISIAQFSYRLVFASCLATVVVSVGAVLFGGAPNKIVKTVVSWITIKMATLHTFWSRANEGFQNEPMHSTKSDFIAVADFDHHVPSLVLTGTENAARYEPTSAAAAVNNSWQRHNSATIRDFVRSFCTNNWQPSFFGHVKPLTAEQRSVTVEKLFDHGKGC